MSADALTIETFAEYGIGMLFLLVRLYARLYVGGLRGLRLDDVFAVSGMIFWSMLTAIIYLLGVYGNNIGLNEQTAMLVPDSKIPHMILGSKLAFMNWIWYICYIWCLKGVLLCLYWKLTHSSFSILRGYLVDLPINTHLPLHAGYAKLADQTLRRRQVSPYPPDNHQLTETDNCTLREPLYIVIAVFNVLQVAPRSPNVQNLILTP
ncbi:hypothetical protein PENNAL_c0043G03538 [Penicillium nalgiovense]|uniref:Uncharacterized protein n=1 Tax=Penicillium nalgiovense TaxID=60175 RepID=A0A1V6Y0S6_PENNA|nr:hypothetical protein PENNAL_c0043G03538 [Penicillium nalgiovense]